MLYAIDGMDGSGKSTAAERLASILSSEGRTVTVITHPDRGTLMGRTAADLLLKEGRPAKMFATFFFIVDLLHSVFHFRTIRTDDTIFVRYTLSVAYLPEHMVKPAYRILSKILPEPDVRIFLDISAKTAIARINARGGEKEMFENKSDLGKTRKKMKSISEGWHIIQEIVGMDELDDVLRSMIPKSGN